MKCYALHRKKIINERKSNQEPPFADIAKCVVDDLLKIYQLMKIPTVSRQRIMQLFKKFHLKYVTAKSQLRKISTSPKIKTQVDEFVKQSKCSLFDICSCKCSLHVLSICFCSHELSDEIQKFIFNQRNGRTLLIHQNMEK